MSGVYLVRHPPVARAWAGRCYGQSDMGWSRAGQHMASRLLEELAALRPDTIVHSGLRRTRLLADRLATRLTAAAVEDPRWRERAFGSWEGQSWDAIWRATGNEMDRMISDPAAYRPGGGETTHELTVRVSAALSGLNRSDTVVVVTHGGPIAVIRATVTGAPSCSLPDLVPAYGEIVRVGRPDGKSRVENVGRAHS